MRFCANLIKLNKLRVSSGTRLNRWYLSDGFTHFCEAFSLHAAIRYQFMEQKMLRRVEYCCKACIFVKYTHVIFDNYLNNMKNKLSLLLLLMCGVILSACKKDSPDTPEVLTGKITSPEFINDLLFVDKGAFKIQTDQAATFSSDDQYIQLTADGTINRLTSGEVAKITVNWTNLPGQTSTIYALGATDTTFDEPYASYHEIPATDPAGSYKKGWETLQKLPISNATYTLVLRHADASVGRDLRNKPSKPANWWKSSDPALARQLNQQGRDRSVELGKIIKDLQYPISRIITSEYRRSTETVELMNIGPITKQDARVNHPSYNLTGKGLFNGMMEIVNEEPIDNTMTLLVAHHPMNETGPAGYPSFPLVSPFTWTGAMFLKTAADKTITYEGAVSWAMFKYYRDKKLNRL